MPAIDGQSRNGAIPLTSDANNDSIDIPVSVTGTYDYDGPSSYIECLECEGGTKLTMNAFGGFSTSGSFSIVNDGDQDLVISNVTMSQDDALCSGCSFSISGFSGKTTLRPGESLPITIKFTPVTSGLFLFGSLEISSNTQGGSGLGLTSLDLQGNHFSL